MRILWNREVKKLCKATQLESGWGSAKVGQVKVTEKLPYECSTVKVGGLAGRMKNVVHAHDHGIWKNQAWLQGHFLSLSSQGGT